MLKELGLTNVEVFIVCLGQKPGDERGRFAVSGFRSFASFEYGVLLFSRLPCGWFRGNSSAHSMAAKP